MTVLVAPSADVSPEAVVGAGCSVWHLAQIRAKARLGDGCVVGRGAYVDAGVVVGHGCKIQNYALLYGPAVLEDGVFVGPGAVLTNDRRPRAVNPDGTPKTAADWTAEGVVVGRGASIGARAVVLAGVSIGPWAMVGAGAVVTRNVPPHGLVTGAPARRVAWVGRSGATLEVRGDNLVDPETAESYEVHGDTLKALS